MPVFCAVNRYSGRHFVFLRQSVELGCHCLHQQPQLLFFSTLFLFLVSLSLLVDFVGWILSVIIRFCLFCFCDKDVLNSLGWLWTLNLPVSVFWVLCLQNVVVIYCINMYSTLPQTLHFCVYEFLVFVLFCFWWWWCGISLMKFFLLKSFFFFKP